MSDITQIGHYLIQSVLRRGRSADSYSAENAAMRSQKVLLRVLHPQTASDPAFVREFMEEVRTAARLEHNCIASVLDLQNDGEHVYAVLEFIEGLELNELLERFGPPPPEVVVAIMHEVSSALEHAHGKSILHRRLLPRLIKVTPEGGVKVLGFGMSEREGLMQSSFMPDEMREELYRSPEQVREEPQDARSDLYTLAVISYELLTQRLPFETTVGPADPGALRKPPPIFEHNPLVPTALARLLDRMLAERREERPADAGEVRRALGDLLESLRVRHCAELLRTYLGSPFKYAERTKPRALEQLLRDAEGLASGDEADRRAALEELERLLAEDPNHEQAQSLMRRLRPEPDPGGMPAAVAVPPPEFDPERTMLDVPGEELAARPTRAASPAPKQPGPPASPGPGPERKPAAPRAPDRDVRESAPPALPAPQPGSTAAGPVKKWLGMLAGVGVAVAVLAVGLVIFLLHSQAPKPPGDEALGGPGVADSLLRLDVETSPPGAQVLLPASGETQVSPTTFENLRPGPTRVHVTLAGYRTRDTLFALAAGKTGLLSLGLVPVVATDCTLFVNVTPRADHVLVDGLAASPVDSSSWFMSVGAGTHSLEITAAGYVMWSRVRAVKVAVGANARVRVTLQPQPVVPVAPVTLGTAQGEQAVATETNGERLWQVPGGTKVTVECEPEAQLFVDGVAYPTLVRSADLSMAPGEHRFRFVHPDYVEAVKLKTIKRGQKRVKLKHDFRLGSGILSIFSPDHGAQVFVHGKFSGYPNLVVRDVPTGRCLIELRDKSGTKVLASKEVIVDNSSVPIQVKF